MPNLKEIKMQEGYLNIFVILCKEKCEENWGTNISGNAEFDM